MFGFIMNVRTVARSAHQQHISRRLLFSRIALCVTLVSVSPASVTAQTIEADSLLTHVRYLASDALAGRESGEPGADSAAHYIADRMKAIGLTALGTEGYLQPFNITTTISIPPESRLVFRSASGERELVLFEEWLPFSFSAAGSLNVTAKSAGYGLDDESYAAAGEVAGSVVVLHGGTPENFNPHGDRSPRFKATRARDKGASAVLITVPRIQVPQVGQPPSSVGIPAIQVLESDEIHSWLESEQLSIELDADVQPVKARAYNVVGRVDGRDPSRQDEIIVIGAHYDHLGMGGPGSLSPDEEAIHNGADDNASGTAALLELARYFAADPARRPARSLVFVAFAAEEMGLLGSDYFVKNLPFPLESVVAMVNFDMVGRLRKGRLQVFGSESAEEFRGLLDSLEVDSGLTLTHIGDGYGPSDQTSFYARQIPVLHLFTGTHPEYHRPDDDWQLINADGLAQVTEFAARLVGALGDEPEPFQVVEGSRPAAGGTAGYGPYLGTIPDFGEVEEGGVRLTGVRADSPAERAGLRGQDVIFEFAGAAILNIYDYTYALRAHVPGDTVTIKVRRAEEVVELTAVLAKRQ